MTNDEAAPRLLQAGSHLNFFEVGGWEFVHRTRGHGVVGVVAMTDEREIVLVEQFRPPTGCRVVELPAGLVADEQAETATEAAARELEEEAGFRARELKVIWQGPSSAGLTDEIVTVVLAEGLERIHAGGGVGDESIEVHLVPLDELERWLSSREDAGSLVDLSHIHI